MGGDTVLRGDLNRHRIAAHRKADGGGGGGTVDRYGRIGITRGRRHGHRADTIGHRGRIGQRAAGKAWAQAAAAQDQSRKACVRGGRAGHSHSVALGGHTVLRGDLNSHRIAAHRKADGGGGGSAVDRYSRIGVTRCWRHGHRADTIGHRGRIGRRTAGKAWAQATAAQG